MLDYLLQKEMRLFGQLSRIWIKKSRKLL